MRKYVYLAWFVLMISGSMLLTNHHASAISSLGPDDAEYNTDVDYTVSNTIDVAGANTLAIPVYSVNKPPNAVPMSIHLDKGEGCVQLNAGPFTGVNYAINRCYGSTDYSYYTNKFYIKQTDFLLYLPVGNFTYDSRTGMWSTIFYVNLPGPQADRDSRGVNRSGTNYINLHASVQTTPANPRLIGYSASNTPKFAIAHNHRCDPGGDTSGCNDYSDYNIPFAGACDQGSGNQYVILYDDDNPSGSAPYGIQPQAFSVNLFDVTTGQNVPLSNPILSGGPSGYTPRGTGSNSYDVRGFTYLQGHKYQLRLSHVYANNVIQFKLPFDSIYSQVSCHWQALGTTNLYKTKKIGSTTVCDTSSSGAIANGSSISSNTLICAENYITADPRNTQQTDDISYGIRYVSSDPSRGGWDPIDPPPGTSRPYSAQAGVPGACALPNASNVGVILSTDSRYNASQCSASRNIGPVQLDPGEQSGAAQNDPAYAPLTRDGRYHFISIPGGTPNNTLFCEWIAFTPINQNGDADGYSSRQCISITSSPGGGNTTTTTCNTDDVPDIISIGSGGLSFTAKVDTTSPVPPYGSFTSMRVDTPGGGTAALDHTVPVAASLESTSGGQTTVTSGVVKVLTPLVAGVYTVHWTWTGNNGAASPDCPAQVVVGYTPFFSVKGGDIAAGADFANSSGTCAQNPMASIISWNHDNTPAGDYGGGGAGLAALALGDIKHFVTSQVGAPIVPNALAFANTPTSAAPAYGGNFKQLPCEPDYYANADANNPKDLSPGSMTINDFNNFSRYPQDNKEHVYNIGTGNNGGDLRLNLGSNVVNSSQVLTFRVNGNVYIDSNILYSYPDLAHVPRLSIYAAGSIFVNGVVQEMHGVYVAEQNPDLTLPFEGYFATCYNAAATPSPYDNHTATDPETTDYDTCNHPLTIYGSVTADVIHLDRTYGNLYTAAPGGTTPAEVFQYTPELWLSNRQDCQNDPTAAGCGQFTTLSGLPPVL